jgi:hypothetical protein
MRTGAWVIPSGRIAAVPIIMEPTRTPATIAPQVPPRMTVFTPALKRTSKIIATPLAPTPCGLMVIFLPSLVPE